MLKPHSFAYYILIEELLGMRYNMRRICGFILFWIAVGIAIGLYMGVSFCSILFIFVCILLGYNLFCN